MKEDISFTKALNRLKEITEELDKGDLELEEALKLYEEGVKLHKKCLSKLESAKLKFEELNKES
ncbi:exodeoxyribonuclease VII small subunit [candidate division WWE3 bacterium RIFCSPHIGHO2_01_FULL_40_23]|uniref:Exodeoxyribonuclease 7 small subunit n=1 Tax=candidate division WWE3 bacterium RIFCSPLOWO2_01_FULL_41_18 TaxID=1802625 RepID=A0A1F4VD39_UNCKA|nr:MAG: exodeoxyribonuclease VII small subunit [candidate division WWE3 bacterium RIFCSPHIGHO2_01_FULL_40_23]OGC55186.1 MAG: exodeoxyribonuclease VII small subunit [candidate division WWE3 bacterium RIFCSPLOWO2_01_FULL_41_18]